MTHYEARPILGSASDLGEGTLWDERSGFFICLKYFTSFCLNVWLPCRAVLLGI